MIHVTDPTKREKGLITIVVPLHIVQTLNFPCCTVRCILCIQFERFKYSIFCAGSEISFFKNGICQGVAFKDLQGGRYYPAASMFTLPNEPNCTVKFNFGPDFECFPEDFNERPIPRPMSEVPYLGFDNKVENEESNEKKSQKE